MPDTHLYKTKLCLLYQKGNCHRHSCSFAHGDEELRNKPPGRFYQNYNRDRSYSRRSPGRRFDNRRLYDREASRSWSPNNRGVSKSPSPSSPRSTGQKRSGSNIEREGEGKKPCKVEHQSEISDSRPPPEEAQSDAKEVQSNILAEQLQKAEADLQLLDTQKMRVENSLDRANEENQNLLSRISEYEARLNEMHLTNQRLERFQKAYVRVLRCQDELRRAENKLQRLFTEDDGYRMYYDPVYEGEQQDYGGRWKTSNGAAANGLDKHRDPGYDDRAVTDNGSEGLNFLETGFQRA